MTFNQLEPGDIFEFVTGPAGRWQKVSPRRYSVNSDTLLWRLRRQAKAADEVRLVEKAK